VTPPLLFCPHGAELGDDRDRCRVCAPGDYHYCSHGVNQWVTTRDGQPSCPTCRGATRRSRNAAAPGFTTRSLGGR